MLKKIIFILVLTFISVSLFAGYMHIKEVVYWQNPGNKEVILQGSLEAARFSADSNQYIGCQVLIEENVSGGVTKYALCGGMDKDGKGVYGYTDDPEIIKIANSISRGSTVTIHISKEMKVIRLKTSVASCN